MRFLCLLLFILSIKQMNSELEFDEIERECIAVSEVPESLVIYAKQNYEVPAGDQKYKNFLSCCWKKYGYMSHGGILNRGKIEDVLEMNYSREISRKLVDHCVHIKGITDGDTAALVLKCLDDHAPSLHGLYSHYG